MELDFSAHYNVRGYRGVAFYLKGYSQRSEEVVDDNGWATGEVEDIEDREWVYAVMVGDDQAHLVEVDDLTKIDEDEFCHECGQLGCTHDGRERT